MTVTVEKHKESWAVVVDGRWERRSYYKKNAEALATTLRGYKGVGAVLAAYGEKFFERRF